MSLLRRIRRNRERAKYGSPLRKIKGMLARRCPVCRGNAEKVRAAHCKRCGGYGWLIEAPEDQEP